MIIKHPQAPARPRCISKKKNASTSLTHRILRSPPSRKLTTDAVSSSSELSGSPGVTSGSASATAHHTEPTAASKPAATTKQTTTYISDLTSDPRRKQQTLKCTIFTPTKAHTELLPVDFVSFPTTTGTIIFRGYKNEFNVTHAIQPGLISFQPTKEMFDKGVMKGGDMDRGVAVAGGAASPTVVEEATDGPHQVQPTSHPTLHPPQAPRQYNYFTSGGVAVKMFDRVVLSLTNLVEVDHLDFDKVQAFMAATNHLSLDVLEHFYALERGTADHPLHHTKQPTPQPGVGFKYLSQNADAYVVAHAQDVTIALDRLYKQKEWLQQHTAVDFGLTPDQSQKLEELVLATKKQ